jgi:hypothetical protein
MAYFAVVVLRSSNNRELTATDSSQGLGGICTEYNYTQTGATGPVHRGTRYFFSWRRGECESYFSLLLDRLLYGCQLDKRRRPLGSIYQLSCEGDIILTLKDG